MYIVKKYTTIFNFDVTFSDNTIILLKMTFKENPENRKNRYFVCKGIYNNKAPF